MRWKRNEHILKLIESDAITEKDIDLIYRLAETIEAEKEGMEVDPAVNSGLVLYGMVLYSALVVALDHRVRLDEMLVVTDLVLETVMKQIAALFPCDCPECTGKLKESEGECSSAEEVEEDNELKRLDKLLNDLKPTKKEWLN